MITIDRFGEILDELVSELPGCFFDGLNGGVSLLPEAKLHEKSIGDDLYVMGEYIRSHSMGRRIEIYYGSFEKTCRHMTENALKAKIRSVLRHEFRHHIESLANESSLEKDDDARLAEYIRKKRRSGEPVTINLRAPSDDV